MTKNILAIDPGLHFGWAYRVDLDTSFSLAELKYLSGSQKCNRKALSERCEIISGHHKINLEKSKFSEKTDSALLYLNFLKENFGKGGNNSIDILAFETLHTWRYVPHAISYSSFYTCSRIFCEDNGIRFLGCDMNMVKKYISGNLTAKKQTISNEMKRIYGEAKDHNELDALSILEYAITVSNNLALFGRK